MNAIVTRAGSVGESSRFAPFAFERDAGAGHRAAIGVVALANDFTIEPELARFLRLEGVAVYANRLQFPTDTTVETLAAMEAHIGAVAAEINRGVPMDVIAFGCTSGTIAIGPKQVRRCIRSTRPDVQTTNPITAALTGLDALGCRRIALLTPYIDPVNEMMADFVEARGFDIAAAGSFKIKGSLDLCRVTPGSVRAAALELGRADVDAVFISCTGLRVSSIVEELEAALDKPVVASNQAIAWHALRLAGCQDEVAGFGRLLRTPFEGATRYEE